MLRAIQLIESYRHLKSTTSAFNIVTLTAINQPLDEQLYDIIILD